MVDAKSEDEWFRAASIICMVHNVNCTNKNSMKKVTDFMPFEKYQKKKLMPVPITALKALMHGKSSRG